MKITAKAHVKGDASKALKKVFKSFGSLDIRIGIPSDAAPYPDGTPVAMVAMVHEFGSPSKGIPERSFMRSTIDENQPKYIGMAQRGVKKVIAGKIALTKVANLIGLAVAGDMQQKIVELKTPANAPSTIKAKGSDNPLVDTGHLGQSVRHEVVVRPS